MDRFGGLYILYSFLFVCLFVNLPIGLPVCVFCVCLFVCLFVFLSEWLIFPTPLLHKSTLCLFSFIPPPHTLIVSGKLPKKETDFQIYIFQQQHGGSAHLQTDKNHLPFYFMVQFHEKSTISSSALLENSLKNSLENFFLHLSHPTTPFFQSDPGMLMKYFFIFLQHFGQIND